MRASLSSENPGSVAILPVILSAAMNDMKKSWPALSLEEAHAHLTAPGAAFETAEITVRGVPMRVWKHVPATAAEAFARARAFGPREFLVYGCERVSYEGFARAALRVSNLLVG